MLLGTATITDKELDRLKSRLGKELRVVQHKTVASQDNITWSAYAIGDDNPLWLDRSYASNTRYGCTITPPSFLFTVLTPTGALAGGLPGVHSFYGGSEWKFFKPIRVNTKISASAKLVDVTEKVSSYAGRSVIVTTEVSYKDQHDTLLASARGWSIRTERETARQRGKYAEIPSPTYTAEQSQAIEESCLSAKPLGTAILYWDDINEQDELPALAKGPLAREDMEAFLAATGSSFSTYFRVKHFRKHPAFFYRDPSTNNWEPVSMVNLYDYTAQAVGIPRAYDAGGQRICWLEHMLTNWMGNDGILERLNVKLIRPNLYGDTQWCKGRITRKYSQGERSLADIDIWCENQSGEQTAVGTATVCLLSRKITHISFK